MKGFILYSTYKIIDNKALVLLYGRLENNETFLAVNEYKPYFYIKESDLKKALKLEKFEYKENKFKNFDNETVIKVIKNLPNEISELRIKFKENNISYYEADVKFVNRFLIDYDINSSLDIEGDYERNNRVDRIYKEAKLKPADYFPTNLKLLSLDIETDCKSGKILYCIGLYGKNYSKVFLNTKNKVANAVCCSDENDLLLKFKEEFLKYDPDILTGWNLVDFDLNYLKNKFDEYGVNFDLGRSNERIKIRTGRKFFSSSKADTPGRQVLDGINLLMTSFVKLDDYKLDSAAHQFLGERKTIDNNNKHIEIDRMYKDDQEKLIKYNLNDCKLVYDIIQKTDVLNLTIQRSILTGMPLDNVKASIASLDSLYIKEAIKRKIICPTGKYEDSEERITGGFVMESKPGIYDYILVLDFKSLYPSLMRTFNIDPYSFTKEKTKDAIIAPNKAMFRNEDGILPKLLTDLSEARNKAKKEKNKLAIHAIKILLNSFFGVLASPSCRFYNLDVANAITHFARYIVQLTGKKINEFGYEVIYEDSITKDRFVTLLINEKLTIKNIEELFNDYKKEVITIDEKEKINLSNYNIKSLTINKNTKSPEFSKINEIIRHKSNKKIFRINQKYGETICTEDHSIMVLENNKLIKTKPIDINNRSLIKVKFNKKLKEIKIIDFYEILKSYKFKKNYKGREKIAEVKLFDKDHIYFGWMNRKEKILLKRFVKVDSKDFEALCRLLGAYIAEGSSSTPETTKSRIGSSISNSDKKFLEIIQQDYYRFFKNAKVSIIKSTKKVRELTYYNNKIEKKIIYEDKTNKLQLMNGISAVFFKMLCGQKSHYKKLPEFIYHVDDKYKRILLNYAILGDGSKRENDIRYSKAYKKKNFTYCTSSLQLVSGLTFLLGQLNINYSIRYRPEKNNYTISTSSKNNVRIKTTLTQENYTEYVYDLNIENNHMFVDSCGQILLHNTDSNFVISNATSYEEANKLGKKIEEYINNFYKDFIKKEYKRTSVLELQFEKCFIRFLMPKLRGSEKGAKKRYAGLILNEKGKEEIAFTGMEAIRGDWTDAAKKFQYEVLNRIFHKEEVFNFIKQFVKDLRSGKFDKDLVYRKSIRKDLNEYTKISPVHVKAARKLDKLESNIIEYYITEDGPEPIQKLKHKIDYNHYINKQIKPIADAILLFFDKKFDDMTKGKQNTLFDF